MLTIKLKVESEESEEEEWGQSDFSQYSKDDPLIKTTQIRIVYQRGYILLTILCLFIVCFPCATLIFWFVLVWTLDQNCSLSQIHFVFNNNKIRLCM